MKHALKKTLNLLQSLKKVKLLQKKVMLILFEKKTLCILVVHYYKYNLFSLKLKINDDISYYPQLLLQQCACKRFINKVIYHPDLEFTDAEP